MDSDDDDGCIFGTRGAAYSTSSSTSFHSKLVPLANSFNALSRNEANPHSNTLAVTNMSHTQGS